MQVKILERVIDNIKKGEHKGLGIEAYCNEKGVWVDAITGELNTLWFDFDFEYRIKPETITINGVEIPKPLREEEVIDGNDYFFVENERALYGFGSGLFIRDNGIRFVYRAREEAITASKALFGVE